MKNQYRIVVGDAAEWDESLNVVVATGSVVLHSFDGSMVMDDVNAIRGFARQAGTLGRKDRRKAWVRWCLLTRPRLMHGDHCGLCGPWFFSSSRRRLA